MLRAVVCGPCWAAHGGSPDAEEIGPAPAVTVTSADPRDQGQWLSALRRQAWVEQIRSDGRANLIAVARLVALYAGWDTLESRPTWARLVARSGLSERTVARWLQELRVRGWLAHLEHGSTPAHRPMVLTSLAGNRAAVYGLRIPLTAEEAVHRALEHLLARLVTDLTGHDMADATQDVRSTSILCQAQLSDGASQRPLAAAPPVPLTEVIAADRSVTVLAGPSPRAFAGSAQPILSDQDHFRLPGDKNGSPSWSGFSEKDSGVGGFSRARKPVNNSVHNPSDPRQPQPTALRAGLDDKSGPEWATTVPTSRFTMLIAADWLRHRLPVFAGCSRKLIRHLCKPYWQAGWCNRDIVHAMDHRPGLFDQTPGVLICPQRIATPQAFIASRLAAWRTPDGAILPGHWTARVTDAAAARAARRRVADRHGRAGAALLRPGERVLTTQHIINYGRTTRPTASPTTRAAAKATLAAALVTRRADRRGMGRAPGLTVTA